MITSHKRNITINIIGGPMSQLVDDAGIIKAQMGAAGYECAAQRIEYAPVVGRYAATQFYIRKVSYAAQG